MSSQTLTNKIALPYAEALLEYSKENQLIKKFNANLMFISDLLLASIDLKLFLYNPLIAAEVKKNVLKQLFSDQIHPFVLNFLLVLVNRRRINLINSIINKYFDLIYKLDSIAVAKVSTAVVFTEAQQDALVNKLKDITESKQVKLEIKVDRSLIGGFIIQIGSKVIDTSLLGKVQQMAFYLKAN